MADEQEFDGYDEELEDTPEGSPGADDDHEDDEGADRAPVNRWESRRSLSELMDDDAEDAGDDSQRAHPAAERDEDEDDDEEEDEEDDEPKPKGAQPPAKAGAEGEGAQRPRFRVVDAEGKPAAFELPKGFRLQFRGDGADHTVERLEDLVQLAQKGTGFDSVVSRYEERLNVEADQAEQILLSVLFGDTIAEDDPDTPGKKIERQRSAKEVRDTLRPHLKKFLDPEYREGQKALAEKATKESQAKAARTEQIEHARTEFWQATGAKIGEFLTELPALTREDAPEITTRFYGLYERAFEQKFAELTAAGVPEARAQEEANKVAFAALSDANLRRVMRGLHAELEPERRTRDVQRHNDTTKRKLRSRQESPKLRGSARGAAPGIPGRGAPDGGAPRPPRTFAERQSRISGLFSKLRGEGGED